MVRGVGRHAGPGCYGGIAPIEGGRFNVAFSVPAEWVKAAGGVEGAFARIIEGSPPLAEQLRPGRRVSQWLASPLPRYGVQRDWLAGVIPIGNAAAAIEPIGGEGMGLALRSAELAVGMILSNGDAASLWREYRRLWRMRGWACRAAAMCVSRPALCGVAVEAMASWEAMRDAALSWMGKAPTPRCFHSGPVG
jgi:flavin-dependent dehydrogenase